MYSAIKVNGKKLYEYAREGKEVKLEARDIEIYKIELLEYQNNKIKFSRMFKRNLYKNIM